MELQFHKSQCQCLQKARYEVKDAEQTQEVRLGDAMPDIARVVSAWGQVIMRSKQWCNGQLLVSGGVMAWVLYTPEGDGKVHSVETWLPFQIKWDMPETEREGVLLAKCLLRSIDARSVSARKLMVRSVVSVLAEALLPGQTEVFAPEETPEDLQILVNSYPLQLPVEAGEKPFSIEEEIALPGTCPKSEKLLRYAVQPELIDKKVLGARIVFRGMVLVHIAYETEDGLICSADLEVPFSQFSELDRSYEQDAVCQINLMTTNLEVEMDPEGKCMLKVGLTGQYTVYERRIVELAEDAYSVQRPVQIGRQQLQLPAVLDMRTETIHAMQSADVMGSRIADVAFYLQHPYKIQTDQGMQLVVCGQFQLLYYDENGRLQCANPNWQSRVDLPQGAENSDFAETVVSGKVQGSLNGGAGEMGCDVVLSTISTCATGLPMITELTLGEVAENREDRPSLILRRKGSDSLWEVAKSCASTVEAIRRSNHLDAEPEEDQMLLIPVF